MTGTALSGRAAVVTGAGRGIGREIALRFAREGARLAVCSRHAETIEPVAEEIRAGGGTALARVVDISVQDQVEKFVEDTFGEFGRVDVLVNNAGINRDNFFLRMKPEEWDAVMAVNLRGTFLVSRFFSRRMIKQKSGRVINITSVAGEAGSPGQANYSAAKAGITALTKTMAKELARHGICVNAISPGYVETEMVRRMEGKVLEGLADAIPLGRLGSVCDVAGAAVFLASDDSSYITGQVIRVDGGLYI
ncbi:MAG: 3-oxoacyl-[acyl-carrier-protein] reductase [bacterium]